MKTRGKPLSELSMRFLALGTEEWVDAKNLTELRRLVSLGVRKGVRASCRRLCGGGWRVYKAPSLGEAK